ncbi:putative mediator of RNA polymerase II transcription subunit 26c [Arachis hypogaea]|nr:putative mediator of RNA polymerase II transcription subunit 26c [Arachis hypogaea]
MHELLLLSVAATSASSAAVAAAVASHNLSLSSLASHEIPPPPLSSHLLPSLQSSLCRRSHRICFLCLLFHLISTHSLSSSPNHLKFQVPEEYSTKFDGSSILKETDIGRHVNRLQKHSSNDVRRLVKLLKWKEIVDEWVRLNQPGGTAFLMGLMEKSLIEFQSKKGDVLPAHKNQSQCLVDLCGALHCDIEINFGLKKSKCNPAAAARNKHLCESLADSCFPVNDGSAASRLHEFFLQQFCDAHSCTGSRKPFSRGRRRDEKGNSTVEAHLSNWQKEKPS